MAALPRAASAEVYPSRTVRIITPFGSAGAPDIITRMLAQWLTERLGQSFVVEIRAGGAGQIGTEAAVRAAPDGYTLLVLAPSHVINTTLYDKLSYNFLRDIAPVAAMIRSPNVLVVNPSLPVNSVPELIAYAKANPGKLNMGSVGIGGNPHVAGELFKIMSGIDMVHVPYRSAAAVLTDLISGQVQVYFASSLSSKEYIKNGQLRALAITSATRTDLVPGVPALAEFLSGYEASAWFGIGAPANTPAEIIDKLNAEINRALADPKILASLDRLGAMPMVGTPAGFGTFLAEERTSGRRSSGPPTLSRNDACRGALIISGWVGASLRAHLCCRVLATEIGLSRRAGAPRSRKCAIDLTAVQGCPELIALVGPF